MVHGTSEFSYSSFLDHYIINHIGENTHENKNNGNNKLMMI